MARKAKSDKNPILESFGKKLKALGIKLADPFAKTRKEEVSPKEFYEFCFQGEVFAFRMNTSWDVRIELCFGNSVEPDEIALLQMVCNHINLSWTGMKMFYDYIPSTHEYLAYLTLDGTMFQVEYLGMDLSCTLRRMIKAKQDAVDTYAQWKKWYGTENPERERGNLERQRFLEAEHSPEEDGTDLDEEQSVRDMSFEHYEKAYFGKKKKGARTKKGGKHFDAHDIVAYSPLLTDLVPLLAPSWDITDVLTMKILCDQKTITDDLDVIAWQPLLAPMTEGYGLDTCVREEDCTYILRHMNGDSLTLHVHYKGQNRRYQLFDLTVVRDELSLDIQPTGRRNLKQPSLLIAIDMREEDRRRAEYHYMCLDAEDKIRKAMEDELEPPQYMMQLCDKETQKQLFYFGTQAFLEGKFAQALIPLMRVYKSIAELDEFETRTQRKAYYEGLYMIGYCLNALHQYDKAAYYLAKTLSEKRINCVKEYVYALSHLHDDHLIFFLSYERDRITSMIIFEEDNVEEYILEYRDYLSRQLIEACIRHRQYERAETLLRQEVEMGNNVEYAEEMLRKVHELKSQKKGQ